MLGQIHKEYSHFQNVTLAKELADSRTISLDRADIYHIPGADERTRNHLLEVFQEASGAIVT